MVNCKCFLNSMFAVNLDVTSGTETIIFGKVEDVKNCILSDCSNVDNVRIYVRNLGSFIFDFSQSFFLKNYYADGKLPKLFENNAAFDYLISLVNEVKKLDAHNSDTEAFIDFLEFTQIKIFNDSFIEAQRHLSLTENKKPNVEKMLDYLSKYLYQIVPDNDTLAHIETDSYTFVATDYNMYALIKYYLRVLYQNGLYPRICMRCGKKFIANAYKLAAVLCSDQCRKEALYEQQKAYTAKNNTDYDTNCMKCYKKWYGKINRIKKKNILTEAELNVMTEIFDDFTKGSLQMKKDAKSGAIPPNIFEQWLADFDSAMTALFNQIKNK